MLTWVTALYHINITNKIDFPYPLKKVLRPDCCITIYILFEKIKQTDRSSNDRLFPLPSWIGLNTNQTRNEMNWSKIRPGRQKGESFFSKKIFRKRSDVFAQKKPSTAHQTKLRDPRQTRNAALLRPWWLCVAVRPFRRTGRYQYILSSDGRAKLSICRRGVSTKHRQRVAGFIHPPFVKGVIIWIRLHFGIYLGIHWKTNRTGPARGDGQRNVNDLRPKEWNFVCDRSIQDVGRSPVPCDPWKETNSRLAEPIFVTQRSNGLLCLLNIAYFFDALPQ